MSIVPEFHLEHLFRRMFTPSELRQALFFAPDRGDLSDHLLDADRVSPASFARQAVAAAVARGLPFTQGLWSYLAELKPERAAEIWAVAALFGVHHPKAGALEPLPAEWADHVVAEEGLRTFVGRGEQLRQLRDTLLPRAGRVRAAVVCNLRGMAGVGKSFLVERFYASHREAFPGGHQKLILGGARAANGGVALAHPRRAPQRAARRGPLGGARTRGGALNPSAGPCRQRGHRRTG
jgi:hypothetical protein